MVFHWKVKQASQEEEKEEEEEEKEEEEEEKEEKEEKKEEEEAPTQMLPLSSIISFSALDIFLFVPCPWLT